MSLVTQCFNGSSRGAMWKIVVLFISNVYKGVVRTVTVIIRNKTIRWIVIVCSILYGLYVFGGYLEEIMILDIAKDSTKNMMPICYEAKTSWWTKAKNFFFKKDEEEPEEVGPEIFFPDPDITPWRRLQNVMRFGYPSMNDIRFFEDFVVSYNRQNKIANWVCEHLNANRTYEDIKDYNYIYKVKEDEKIHPYFRAKLSDFKRPGYLMRQLATVENRIKMQNNIQDAFCLTNMVLQKCSHQLPLESDLWSRLDQHVRDLTQTHKEVYSCTGPVFMPQERNGKTFMSYKLNGKSGIAIPTHIFKVVIAKTQDKKFKIWCYMFENKVIIDKLPLDKFHVDLVVLEKNTGLHFTRGLALCRFASINEKLEPLEIKKKKKTSN